MKRIDLAKQNFFKQYDQLSMPSYGECFEAGFLAACKVMDDLWVERYKSNFPSNYNVSSSAYISCAYEEIDEIPPCGTDEVNLNIPKATHSANLDDLAPIVNSIDEYCELGKKNFQSKNDSCI